jgi:hypothetical protein
MLIFSGPPFDDFKTSYTGSFDFQKPACVNARAKLHISIMMAATEKEIINALWN